MPAHNSISVAIRCTACGHRDSTIFHPGGAIKSTSSGVCRSLGVCRKCGAPNREEKLSDLIGREIPTLSHEEWHQLRSPDHA